MSRIANAPLSLHALTALGAPLMLAQCLYEKAIVLRLPELPGAREGVEGGGPAFVAAPILARFG